MSSEQSGDWARAMGYPDDDDLRPHVPQVDAAEKLSAALRDASGGSARALGDALGGVMNGYSHLACLDLDIGQMTYI
jgi:hypothetical protein